MGRNLLARVLVAAVAIPAILWIAYRGGFWLVGLIGLLALIAISEFLINEGFGPRSGLFWLGFTATAVLIIVNGNVGRLVPTTTEAGMWSATTLTVVVVMSFFTVTAITFAIGKVPPAELFQRHSRLLWGIIYVGLLYPIVLRVGQGVGGHSGGDALLFLFGVLWVGDTAAMAAGTWLGKHRLAPEVSPRKTVEGLIGGLLGGVAVGLFMYFWKFHSLGLTRVLLLALGCSFFGQMGDLVESMWKRSLGIKDSSRIIPGHGGVLDRFDSLLFAAPFMYAFFYFVHS
ncbi:MAG TPA: phosphatidate cytidylyltransferase [Candidatus Deferrimicrobium sp.]|nr:phosphatidate cytidylyltransferase [Candidatus Deferrimicrobium sp.]